MSAEAKKVKQVEVLAPGWGELDYSLPEAGSYTLPVIRSAPDGQILLSNGKKANLKGYFTDKISILTFIYTRCNDVNGCPLATFVLHSLQNSLHKRSDLKNKVRFITMSFDPEYDTPKTLSSYAKEFESKEGYEWLFATTESYEELNPILADYGQYTFRMKDENEETAFAHILRAFLIDSNGKIRNIYSVDFLHPGILLRDIETILLESA